MVCSFGFPQRSLRNCERNVIINFYSASLPRRIRGEKYLPNSEQKVQECDATEA
jgi:hypothetical protein